MNESLFSPVPEGSVLNPQPKRKKSEEEFYVASPAPNKPKSTKAYQIDQEALAKYKRILQKRVAWSFVLLFVVIIERIFSGYTLQDENSMIVSLQKSLHITSHGNWYLQPIVFLEQYLYFILIITQFFIIVYYYYNPIICLKIMFGSLNAMAFIALLEIIFGDPRPYWDNPEIVPAGCESSYVFPSYTVFGILFLFMYTWHCFTEDDDYEEEGWDKMDIIKCAVFVVLFGVFCFLKILTGYDYLSQILLSILYAVLLYYLATFFDKAMANVVEKSSIDVQFAKRYTIYWMIYILIFLTISIITYQSTSTFVDINWFTNYYSCLQTYGDTARIDNTPYYHIIGAWGSFLKMSTLFALLGGIFGAAKAFRDFKGVLWYATASRNKLKMTAAASLCVIPSWIIAIFQPSFIVFFQRGGIDSSLFNAMHFTLLYFLIFGILPKYVFNKWGLVNTDSGYFFVADEMMRMDSNSPNKE